MLFRSWIGNGGNWSSLSHWATASGGTTLHTLLPTTNDDVFFDVNSFSLTGQTVTVNQPTVFARNINWMGVLNSPVLGGAVSNTLKIYGSLTLVQGMFMNFTGPVHFSSVRHIVLRQ